MGKYFDVSYTIQAFPQPLELCARNGAHHRYFCHLRCYIRLYYSHYSPQEGTSIKPIIYCIYLLYAGHAVLGTTIPHLLWGARNHVPYGP